MTMDLSLSPSVNLCFRCFETLFLGAHFFFWYCLDPYFSEQSSGKVISRGRELCVWVAC